MTQIPALRASILIEEFASDERFPARLVDKELSQRIRLDALGLRIARALSMPATIHDLVETVGAKESSIERIVTTLERLQVLDTEKSRAFIESENQAKAMAEADPMTVPLLIRDDARFTCSMCGSCCGGQNVGPVSAEKVASLKPKFPILRERTGVKKPFFMDVPVTVDGTTVERTICQSSKGACVFLGEDRLCTIHGEFGGEAKPNVCQVFPYQFKATPEGVSVSLGMECRGFVEARQGKKLKDQEAEIRQMMSRLKISTLRTVITLDDQTTLNHADYMAIETDLHRVVDEGSADPIQTLLTMRDELESRREHKANPNESVDDLVRDLELFQEGFIQSLGELHDSYHHVDDRITVHTGALDHLARGVAGLLPDFERILQPLRRKEARDLFGEYAHHALMGKEFVRARHLVLAFARFNFSWLVVKSIAIDRIRQVKRRHLLPQDIQDALVIMHFLFRGVDAISGLRRHDAQLVSLFYDRLPLMVEVGPTLGLANQPATLYKF
jgi:Fe-S-cluster containining protein